MDDRSSLDSVDQGIVAALLSDARHATNAELGRQVGVSDGTVRNRIDRLESTGLIRGYHAAVDYEQLGLSFRALVVGTASPSRSSEISAEASSLPGVIRVYELLGGEENVFVEVVGTDDADIASLTSQLSEIGLSVTDTLVIRSARDPKNCLEPVDER
ncbi:MAG: Lrp/AsnC family transcriptional regulator [Halobacteriota archaeon]